MVGTHAGAAVGAEEKAGALQAVLESDTFARSERLRGLLRFLCEMEIEGREAELTEYLIATGALGRPKDFAPLEDSSVRSRVYELRQKLEKYYAHEAPHSPIQIELRKGSYVPRFSACAVEDEVVHPADAAPPLPPAVVTPAPSSPTPSAARIAIAAFAAGAALTFAALTVWPVATSIVTGRAGWSPELEAVWRPFLSDRTPVTVAFETRFFVQMGPLVVRDWHVNSLGAAENSEPLRKVQELFGIRQLYGSGNYTDVGTPEAIFHLTRLLGGRVPLLVRHAHDMSASDLRDNNLILVGKPWFEPQIERVLAAADLVDANGRIVNKHPAQGEQAEYVDQQDQTDPDSWSEKYSVITMMPNPAGAKRVLALTASGSEHPAALAYYLTNPETARELVAHVRNRRGEMPTAYQVLVRADFKGKSLIKVGFITWRPLKT